MTHEKGPFGIVRRAFLYCYPSLFLRPLLSRSLVKYRTVRRANQEVGRDSHEETVLDDSRYGIEIPVEIDRHLDTGERRIDHPQPLIGNHGPIHFVSHPENRSRAHPCQRPGHRADGHRNHLDRHWNLGAEHFYTF